MQKNQEPAPLRRLAQHALNHLRFARQPAATVPARRPGAVARRLFALCLVLLVAGCGKIFEQKEPPPCPQVLVLQDAANILRYKEGPGRDITDTSFEGKIIPVGGECDYGENNVVLDVQIVFELVLGPANPDRVVEFEYFVAIPRFHPKPEGKRKFAIRVPFPSRRMRLRFADSLDVDIPIAPKKSGTYYEVYFGFQLTREELERNQKSRPR